MRENDKFSEMTLMQFASWISCCCLWHYEKLQRHLLASVQNKLQKNTNNLSKTGNNNNKNNNNINKNTSD